MPNYNQCLIMGNVTRDPQLKYLQGGTAVVEFGMACNRKYKTSNGEEREDVLFIDCSAFGKQAEVLNQYITKGKPLFVSGRLRLDTWDDKSGNKRSKHSLIVENFQFLGKQGEDDDAAPRAPKTIGEGIRQQQAAKPTPVAPFGDEQHFTDDSIPFDLARC